MVRSLDSPSLQFREAHDHFTKDELTAVWGMDGTGTGVEAGPPRSRLSEKDKCEPVRFKVYLDIMFMCLAGECLQGISETGIADDLHIFGLIDWVGAGTICCTGKN